MGYKQFVEEHYLFMLYGQIFILTDVMTMEKDQAIPATIDEYISGYPPAIREKLEALRKAIRGSAPDAKEKISYRMPAFEQNGILVYFAAFKDHISFFPTGSGVEAFKQELGDYKISKGTIQFPLDKPMPFELVSRIVKFRVAENVKKAESKIKK